MRAGRRVLAALVRSAPVRAAAVAGVAIGCVWGTRGAAEAAAAPATTTVAAPAYCQAFNELVEHAPSEATRQWLHRQSLQLKLHGELPKHASEHAAHSTLSAMRLEEKWRHKVYATALLALLSNEFNGNKNGPIGEYPLRAKQIQRTLDAAAGVHLYKGSGPSYAGHNIAALAVDRLGRILCSEFNHNVMFGSTTEHAEQRLIDRLFQLPAMHFPRGDVRFQDPSFVADVEKEVKHVTVYTSLEPCQQCAGKLQLAGVSQVAFAQRDPDIGLHCSDLYRKGGPTRPIPGRFFDLAAYYQLGEKYMAFTDLLMAAHEKPHASGRPPVIAPIATKLPVDASGAPIFFRGADGRIVKAGRSMPYFLCTDFALDIFDAARNQLSVLMSASDPEWMALTPAQRDSVASWAPPPDHVDVTKKADRLEQLRVRLVEVNAKRMATVDIRGPLPADVTAVDVENALAALGPLRELRMLRRFGPDAAPDRVMAAFASPTAAADAAAKLGDAQAVSPWLAPVSVALLKPTDGDGERRLRRAIVDLEREIAAATGSGASAAAVVPASSAAPAPGTLTNREVLQHAREYVAFERAVEKRGTAHK